MGKERGSAQECAATDWAGSWQRLTVIWGLPATVMVASAGLVSWLRGVVWILMLLFMGGACFANARRCHRTHCYFTGPFLVLMAALVALYTLGLMPLGSNGWGALASITIAGTAILCCVTERIRGRYLR